MIDIRLQHRQGSFTVDATFTADTSGITALFGASGSGKTSIVNMVAGLSKPDRGHITIKGKTVFNADKGIDLPPEQRRIGYIFQDGRLFPHLNVRRNLTYGSKRVPVSRRYVAFDEVVDLLGIRGLLDRRPARLSGGEKQRVAIGRGLLTSPSLLLMDEPLASLDQDRKTEVLPFIHQLCREYQLPILYVTHSIDEIRYLKAHVVHLCDGKVISSEFF